MNLISCGIKSGAFVLGSPSRVVLANESDRSACRVVELGRSIPQAGNCFIDTSFRGTGFFRGARLFQSD